MLEVEKGEKVALVGYSKAVDESRIKSILTIKGIGKKGTISAVDRYGNRYQFYSDGDGKGRAFGRIRKLEPGEEEKFLERKKEREIKSREKYLKEKQETDRKLSVYKEWAKKNAIITKVDTTQSTMYIIDLPAKSCPATIMIHFDNSAAEYKERLPHVWYSQTRGNFTSRGSIMGLTPKSNEVLDIVADWMISCIREGDL